MNAPQAAANRPLSKAWQPPGRVSLDGLQRMFSMEAAAMSSAMPGDSDADGGRTWSWDDGDWMRARDARHTGEMPLSLYRLDAADWFHSRFTQPLDWNQLAQELVPYVADLGFTHIALDDALLAQPFAVICRFVETCHVAGVGVVVAAHARRAATDPSLIDCCGRCHIDGIEEHNDSGTPVRCRLFVNGDLDTAVVLSCRPRWNEMYPRYLASSPAERSLIHADWVHALTPVETDRGVLDLMPRGLAAIGQWRLPVDGDGWQRFAALRALLALMWALPGDKWLAMGVELGQVLAEPFEESMRWPLLFESQHAGLLRQVADLNRLYVNEPALQVRDDERHGFRWLVEDDSDNSVVVFIRLAESGHASLICISNFQARVHHGYRLGVPAAGRWREIFNSDSVFYAGSNVGNGHGVMTAPVPSHAWPQSLTLTVPPMATLFLRHEVWYGDSP